MIKRAMVILWVLWFIGPVCAQTPTDLSNQLQAVVNGALPPGKVNPGLVVGVHVPGQWSWYGATGHSITGTTPGYTATLANPTDQFRAGSITKMFMATAVLMLEEDGLLNISDDIALHLRASLINDTINSSGVITIGNLLEHTSGLGDLAANDSCRLEALSDLTRNFTLEEGIYCGCVQGENFPPGFTWGYSNTNYSILALLIKEVSGLSAIDYIKTNIINPLGLLNTEVPATDEINQSHMGCYWELDTLLDLTIVDASMYNGWANVVSTTEDLFLFFDALRNGTLVNIASLAKMYTISPISFDYGLGIDFYVINGDPYYGHSGEVGNTSGLFYADISTAAFPNGYYLSYNYNYQGVSSNNAIEVPVHLLMKNYVMDSTQVPDTTTQDTTVLGLDHNPADHDLLLYPNPAIDQFSFQFKRQLSGNVELEIYDLIGRKLIELVPLMIDGKIEVRNMELGPGIYHVMVKNHGTTYSSKLVLK